MKSVFQALFMLAVVWVFFLLIQLQNWISTRQLKQDLQCKCLENKQNNCFGSGNSMNQSEIRSDPHAKTQTTNETRFHNVHLGSFGKEKVLAKLSLPMIYIVTPTYSKPTQQAELLALGNTLSNAQEITWIVVEDSTVLSGQVASTLESFQIPVVHLLGSLITYGGLQMENHTTIKSNLMLP